MFIIEVKKKGKDGEFSFKDLEMFHQECYGGKIKVESLGDRDWLLTCQRCSQQCELGGKGREDGIPRIIRTAIDGQEREVSAYGELDKEWGQRAHFKFHVIQKNETK